jgi:hypothetical protein
MKNISGVFDVFVNTTVFNREEIISIDMSGNRGDNQTFNFSIQFNNPYMYGLLNKRSDFLVFQCLNCTPLIANTSGQLIGSNTTKFRIEMQFDYRDEKMAFMKSTANLVYFVMIGLVLLQFVVLFFRNVGFLPLWVLIEYMQLIAFMPLYNFKLIPYLYDAFKPFLVGHLILTEDSLLYQGMSTEFFNKNYLFY